MGCGASKGNSGSADTTQNADITFKKTMCSSMDDFFNSASAVIQAFKDITAPLQEQKDNFYDVTGFWEVCGTLTKHAFQGMFISLTAQANANQQSVKQQWGQTAPYFELDTTGLESSSQNTYEAFVNYINALEACITQQIPDILVKAEDLPTQAERAQNFASGDLEALGPFKKVQALAAIAYNIRLLARIPAMIKQTLQGFKDEMTELQDAMNIVKAQQPLFQQHGVTCATSGVKDPVGCFKKIFGPIKYTMDTRTAWEAWMATFMWQKKSRSFDPMRYGLEDLVQDPAQATV